MDILSLISWTFVLLPIWALGMALSYCDKEDAFKLLASIFIAVAIGLTLGWYVSGHTQEDLKFVALLIFATFAITWFLYRFSPGEEGITAKIVCFIVDIIILLSATAIFFWYVLPEYKKMK